MSKNKTKAELQIELDEAKRRVAELNAEIKDRGGDDRFASVFRASPFQMAFTDQKTGKYVDINQAFLTSLGFSREEVVGHTALELNLFVDPAQRGELLKRMGEQGFLRNEHVRIRHRSGEILHGMFTAEYVEVRGQKLLLTIMNDITENIRAEERWQFALTGASEGVWDWNAQTDKVFYSSRWKTMLGYEESEIGDSLDEWSSRVHPDDLAAVMEEVNRHLRGETPVYSTEHRVRCKDGSYIWILDTGKVMEWTEDNKPLRVIGTHRDITDRRIAEAAVRENEERFSRMFHSNPAVQLIVAVQDGRIVDINEAFCQQTGFTRDELVGRLMSELDLWRDPARQKWIIEELRSKGQIRDIELEFWTKSREVYTLLVSFQIIEINGETCSLSSGVDITARKLAEKALHESQGQLSQALTTARMGTWSFHLPTNQFKWSNEAAQLFGLDTLQDDFPVIVAQFHPEDRQIALDAFQKVLFSGRFSNLEYRMIDNKGNVFWVTNYGNVEYDESGKPVLISGLIQDITERKRMEENLLRSEERYRIISDTVTDYAFSTLVKGNGEYVMDWVSGAFETITGYTFEEFVAAGGWRARLHPDDRLVDDQARSELLANRKAVSEVRIFHKDGREVYLRVFAQPLWDPKENRLKTIYGAVQDITERKRLELELKAEAVRRRILFEEAPDGILVIDPETAKFLEFNTKAHTQLGYTREEFSELSIFDIEAQETREETLKHIGNVVRDGRSDFETLQLTKQGELRNIHVTAQVVEIMGQPVYYCIWRDITDRKRAEEARRESDDRYHLLFRNMVQGVVFQDKDGHIIHANPAAERILGLSMDQMMGRASIDPRWHAIHEDGSAFPGEDHPAMVALRTGKPVHDVIMGVFNPNSDAYRWININAVPRFMEGEKRPYQVFATFEDITISKQAELEMRKGEKRLRSMLGISQAMSESLEMDVVLQKIVENATSLMQLESGAIYTLVDGGLYLEATTPPLPAGFPDELRHANVADHPHIQAAISSGKVIILEDATSVELSNAEKMAAEARGLRSILYIPIMILEKAIGVLIVASVGKLRTFRSEEINLFSGFSGQAAQTIENIRLYRAEREYAAELEVQIAERRQAEEKLRESEARYRLIAENTADVIWVLDPVAGRFTYVSPSVEKLRGYTPDEVMAQPVSEALTPESQKMINASLEAKLPPFLAKGCGTMSFTNEVDQPCKDGSIVKTEATTTYLFNEQGNVEIVGVSRNITERKQAEDDLRESEKKYRGLINGMNDAVWVIDTDSRFLDVNDAAVKMLGYSREELLSMKVSDIDSAIEPEQIQQLIDRLGEEKIQIFETRHKTKDGREIPIEISSNLISYKGRTVIMSIARDITERMRAEQAIKESEERLQLVLEGSQLGYWDWNIETGEVFRNAHWAEMLGYTLEEIKFSVKQWTDLHHPDDTAAARESIQNHLQGRTDAHRIEYRMRTKDGNYKWILDQAKVVTRDAHGKPLRMCGTHTDITERKQYEQAVEQYNKNLSAVVELEHALASALDLELIYERLSEGVQKLFPDIVAVILSSFDAERQMVKAAHVVHEGQVVDVSTLPEIPLAPDGKGTQSQVIRTRQPLIIGSDLKNKLRPGQVTRLGSPSDPQDAQSALYVPLLAQEQILGILQIQSLTPDRFSEEDSKLLSLVANAAAVSIKNTQLYILAQNELTERKKAEQALRISEAQWRSLFETCPAGIALANVQGEFLDANPAYLAQLGYTRDEIAKIHYQDYTPFKWHEQEAQNVAQLKASGVPMYFEKEHIRKDGTVFPVALTGWVMRDESGSPDTLGVFVQDITSIKQAELELRESEERHRLISEMISDYVYIGRAFPDGSSQTEWVSGAFERITGYSFDEIVQRPGGFSGLIFPEDIKKVIDQQPGLFESGSVTAEYRIMRKDGEVRWLRDNMKLIEVDGKAVHLLGAVNDITAQKLAEIALRESETKYRLLVETSVEGIWTMDREHHTSYVNQSMAEMLGYGPDEMLGKKVEEFFFPEDMKTHQLHMEKRHRGEDEVYERRFRRRDGSQLWTLVSARAQKDSQGNFNGSFAMFTDITERKAAEEKLSRLDRRYRALIENAPDGIVLVGLDGKFKYISPSVERLFGYTQEEAFLGDPNVLTYPDDLPVVQFELAKLVEQPSYIPTLQYRFRHKNGEWRWIESTFSNLLAMPDVEAIIINFRDIHDRKLAEEELRLAEQRYRAMIENAPDGIALVDAGGKFKYLSPAGERLTGYSLLDLKQQDPVGMTHPDEVTMVIGELEKVIQDPFYKPTIEYRFLNKSGEWRWVESTYSNLLGLPGLESIIINFRDITERRLVEDALQKSQELLKEAQRIARVGHIEWSGKDQRLTCSDEIYEIFDLPYGSPLSQEVIAGMMTPEEKERLNQLDRVAIQQRADMDYEYSIRTREGAIRWLHQMGRVTYSKEGVPLRMMAIVQDVTERKLSEESLRESRLRTEMALMGAKAAMWDWNVKTGETVFNERWAEIIGYTLKELEPVSIQTWADLCHPDDLKASEKLLNRHFAGETEHYLCEARMKHKNGSWVWVLDSGRVMEWDTDGAPLRMFGTHLDINERKREERYTQARLNLASISYETLDMETLMRAMLDEAEALTDSQIGFFHFVDDSQNTISLQAWSTNTLETMCTAEGKGQHYPVAQAGVWADSIRSGEPRIYNDYASLPQRHELPEGHAPVSRLITLPIKRNNLIVAAIGVGNKPLDYDEHDLEMVRRLAEDAFDVILRKRAEEALRNNEERLRTVADFTYDMEFWLDENKSLLYISPSCQRITGYEREQILGDPSLLQSIVHPEDRPVFDRHHEEEFEHPNACSLDFRIVTAEGGVRWINHACQAVTDMHGKFRGRRVSQRDITERKEADQRLREQMDDIALVNALNDAANRGESLEKITEILSQETRRIYNCIDAGIYLLSSDGQSFILQHNTFPEPLKKGIETLIGRTIPKVHIPIRSENFFTGILSSDKGAITSDPEALQKWMLEFADTPFLPDAVRPAVKALVPQIFKIIGIRSVIMIPLRSAEKMLGAIELSSASVFSDHELERLQNVRASLTEIIKRKQVEQELTASEEKYRGLIKSLNNAISTLDINGNLLYLNDTAAADLGGTPQELMGKNILDLFPEPFAKKQLTEIQNIFKVDHEVILETQSMVKNGLRWYRVAFQPLHDESGEVKQVLINATDIQDLKAAQQELQELNRTLEEKVAQRTAEVQDLYDNAPTGYHSIDADGKFVRVNQTELDWLGYSREKIIGTSAGDFMTEKSRAVFQETLPLFLQRGWISDLELEFIRRDGSILPVSLNATAIRDENGDYLMSRSTIFDITERKQAENELKRNANFTSALLNAVPTPVFYKDKDGRYLGCNDAFVDLMGKTSEEIQGKFPDEIWETEHADLYRQKDIELIQNRNLQAYEATVRDKNGALRSVIFFKNIFQDEKGDVAGLVGAFIDITERKAAELALKESEETYRALFENSNDGIFLLDAEGGELRANQRALDMVGYTLEEFLDLRHFSQNPFTVDFEERKDADRKLEALLRGEIVPLYERVFTAKDGHKVPVEINLSPVRDADGRIVMIQSVVRDIAERKRTEETLRRANLELGRAMRMKDEFLATMSHELRTPLTGILGLSEALQMETYGSLTGRQLKTIKNIEESGRHLLALINDVLDLSKIEAGKLTLEIARCTVQDICQAGLQLTKGMAHHKKQHVNYSAPVEPIFLEADIRRIKQVLANLLSNAIKFTPQNGELGLIVELDELAGQARLVVWDRGIGIKPEELSTLFKPFTQIDGSLSREYSGTGLGLALVKKLVELHQGSVVVESVPGEGSRFIVTLPWDREYSPASASGLEEDQVSGSVQNERTVSGPMILIADDNRVLLDMMGDFLEMKHYRTVRVQSGKELLEKIEGLDPAAILMDIQMPGMDGLEAIRRVRRHANAAIASTPIIAVTALAMNSDRQLCLEAGANDYLSKPVKLNDLVSILDRITGSAP